MFIVNRGERIEKELTIREKVEFLIYRGVSVEQSVERIGVMNSVTFYVFSSKGVTRVRAIIRIGGEFSEQEVSGRMIVDFLFDEEFNIEKVKDLVIRLEVESA